MGLLDPDEGMHSTELFEFFFPNSAIHPEHWGQSNHRSHLQGVTDSSESPSPSNEALQLHTGLNSSHASRAEQHREG